MTMKNKLCLFLLCVISIACSDKKKSADQTLQINPIDSPSKSNSAEPFLFTADDSTVYLSWIEKSEEKSTFRLSTLLNNKWSEPVDIAMGTTWFENWADYPMIAGNGKYLIAHFLDKNGEGTYA